MRRFVLIATLALASTAAAQSAEEAVRRLDAEWARSYAQNDTTTAKALFDDALIVTSGTGTLLIG